MEEKKAEGEEDDDSPPQSFARIAQTVQQQSVPGTVWYTPASL